MWATDPKAYIYSILDFYYIEKLEDFMFRIRY